MSGKRAFFLLSLLFTPLKYFLCTHSWRSGYHNLVLKPLTVC